MIYTKLIISVLLAGGVWLGFSHVKQIGYDDAREHYEEIIKDYNEQLANRMRDVEISSNALVNASAANTLVLSKGIDKIVTGQKQKPLVIIKDGKCIPTKDFSDSFFLINSQVNQAIRWSQK